METGSEVTNNMSLYKGTLEGTLNFLFNFYSMQTIIISPKKYLGQSATIGGKYH